MFQFFQEIYEDVATRAAGDWFVSLKFAVNGWQLAKMKKSIPDMSLP